MSFQGSFERSLRIVVNLLYLDRRWKFLRRRRISCEDSDLVARFVELQSDG
jgi:hypothetical protein